MSVAWGLLLEERGVRLDLPDPNGFKGAFERPGSSSSKPELRNFRAL
jgi:hypothetical protein